MVVFTCGSLMFICLIACWFVLKDKVQFARCGGSTESDLKFKALNNFELIFFFSETSERHSSSF